MKKKGLMQMQEKERKENFVMIKDLFRTDLEIYDSRFTDLHLLVLVYIQRFQAYRDLTFTIGWLWDDLKISNSTSRADTIQALKELELLELIQSKTELKNIDRNTRIELKAVSYDDDFTMLKDIAVNRILELEEDIRFRRTLLYVYADILSRINRSTKYAYPSLFTLRKDLNTTSDTTILRAINKLKEIELIDYGKAGTILTKDNRVTESNNLYVDALEEDYKLNLKRGIANRRKALEEKELKVFKAELANKRRSLSASINHLKKKIENETITEEELKELIKLKEERKSIEYVEPKRKRRRKGFKQ